MYIFSIKTIIDTNYHEIESIINENFKTENHKTKNGRDFPYELPCVEERGSGSGETWEVNLTKSPLTEYDYLRLNEIKSGKWPNFCTRTMLQDLCNREIIPEGCYMIDISW